MSFPMIAARERCSMPSCEKNPRVALVVASIAPVHLCLEHLLEVVTDSPATYPVLQIAGAALRRPEAAPRINRFQLEPAPV